MLLSIAEFAAAALANMHQGRAPAMLCSVFAVTADEVLCLSKKHGGDGQQARLAARPIRYHCLLTALHGGQARQ